MRARMIALFISIISIVGLCSISLLSPNILKFAADISEVDKKFSLQRSLLNDVISESQIMPKQLGNFKLKQGNLAILETGENYYYATYVNNNKNAISFIATLVTSRYNNQIWTERAYLRRCGKSLLTSKEHLDTQIVYVYSVCAELGYVVYNFVWKNGNWVIEAGASTGMNSDYRSLLDFVNSYPF